MYHTQECRRHKLRSPVLCERDDAWLGVGYYYWEDLKDAHQWGKNSKKRTGKYKIYKSKIDCEKVLDTVFNEDHYRFWLKQIEKVAEEIFEKAGRKPKLKQINNYFKRKVGWEVAGILFQDLPRNDYSSIPIRRNRFFIYRKRIQLAVYNQSIILNFTLHSTNNC